MSRVFLVAVLLVYTAVEASAADPAKAGRLHVGVATVDAVDTSRGRTIPTEIWYPARTDGRDAEMIPRAYPLILMAHGFCGSRTNYEYLTTHLASYGFVVAAPDFIGVTHAACDAGAVTDSIDDMAHDLWYVCRTLHDTTGPLSEYALHVRGVPTGMVGHSLGGAAVVEATKLDHAFTATVPLAPAVTAADAPALVDLEPRRAWLVMGGTSDTLVSFPNWTEPFFAGLSTPSFLVRITGGTHGGFSDADSTLSPEALAQQQTIVKRQATAFFVRYLARKPKFAKRLRTRDDGTVAITARP